MVERTPVRDAESDSIPFDDAAPSAHLQLLCLIEQHPDYSQRRLALSMGMSLGKTHYLLRSLFDKGLVKAGKFKSSPDKLSFLYRVTASGLKHRLQLTKRFLSQKESEFESLRTEIEGLRAALEAGERPYTRRDAQRP
jgi:EPS-associated MarR family transcriptional regulator